nr:MAG TPA: hypothetical protein [Caudoviricetes sp.]
MVLMLAIFMIQIIFSIPKNAKCKKIGWIILA